MKTMWTLFFSLALFSPGVRADSVGLSGNTSISTFRVDESPEAFHEWFMTGYKKEVHGQAVDLGFLTLSKAPGGLLAFDDPQYAYLTSVRGSVKETSAGHIEWSYDDAKVHLTRSYVFDSSQPYVDVTFGAEFKGVAPKQVFLVLSGSSPEKDAEERDRKLEYFSDGKLHSIDHQAGAGVEQSTLTTDWIAVTSRYFVFAAVPKGGAPKAVAQHMGGRQGRLSLAYPAGEKVSIPLRFYAGPKDLALMKQVEPKLDQALDLGFFSPFAYLLLRLLKWLYSFAQNYGVAIILLTLIVRMLMYPLVVKSMRSMKAMAKLQPEMQRVRERYANDKQAQNLEMMQLLKTHKYNPMAGCLPILVQIPVFFALYKVLYSAVELYQAPFAFWIHDLSAKDPYYVTPVLLSLVMFWQQKISPNVSADPMQRKMMLYMPLVFGAFMLSLPSGLTLYMLVSGIFGVIQQTILNRPTGPVVERDV